MGHIFKTNIGTFNLYFIDYVSPSNTSTAAYKWNKCFFNTKTVKDQKSFGLLQLLQGIYLIIMAVQSSAVWQLIALSSGNNPGEK